MIPKTHRQNKNLIDLFLFVLFAVFYPISPNKNKKKRKIFLQKINEYTYNREPKNNLSIPRQQ